MVDKQKQIIFNRANKFFDNNFIQGLSEYELVVDDSTIKEHKFCFSISWCLKNEFHLSPDKRSLFGGGGPLLISKISDDIKMADGLNIDSIDVFEAEIRGLETYWCLVIQYSKERISNLKKALKWTTSEVLNKVDKASEITIEGTKNELSVMKNFFDSIGVDSNLELLERKKSKTI